MDSLALLGDLVSRARAAGADLADAVLVGGTSLSVQRRLGQTEQLERSESRDLGLRVFVGRRQAIVASTAVDPTGFARLAERAVAMARLVPEDPFGGLADEMQPVPDAPDLDMEDAAEPSAETLVARANAAEGAALAVPGVTNSEGADAGYGRTEVTLVTSAGFAGRYARTNHSISVTALAGGGHRDGAGLRLLLRRPPGGPRRPGGAGAHGGGPGAGAPEPDPAEDRAHPGGSSTRVWPAACWVTSWAR